MRYCTKPAPSAGAASTRTSASGQLGSRDGGYPSSGNSAYRGRTRARLYTSWFGGRISESVLRGIDNGGEELSGCPESSRLNSLLQLARHKQINPFEPVDVHQPLVG